MGEAAGSARVPDLSLSLVNLNNLDLLRPCLTSLYACTRGLELETLVTENGAPPATLEALAREFPEVQVIAVPEIRGFAANHNAALRRARGRYVALLNDDLLFRDNSLGRMVAFLEAHPKYGAVGARLLNPDGSFQLGPRRRYTLASYLVWEWKLDRLMSRAQSGRQPQSGEMQVATGACLVIRRRALEEVGLLEEQIFFGAEDLDWSLRYERAGGKMYYLADTGVIHLGSATARRDYNPVRVEHYRGLAWYFRRHYGALALAAFRVAAGSGALVRLAYWAPQVFIGARRARARAERDGRMAVLHLVLSGDLVK